MNDVIFSQKSQCDQKLDRETSDEGLTDPLEIIELDEFIEVHREHFEGEHQMLTEDKTVDDPYHVPLVLRIFLSEAHQDGSFD
jgi:hypothetical protein